MDSTIPAQYNPGVPSKLARPLLSWYRRNARELPWRGTGDPYAVWISEVMLQQTRVGTVLPYYDRWMKRFPTVRSLSAAPLDEVLRLWEGLGYYRRAANLHLAARQVVQRFGGRLPEDVQQLEALPGIGRYSAAAIAALAFGQDQVALDGNLRRVLSRYIDLEIDPRSAEGERRLRAAAERAMPAGEAADFNQALMDLAATVCTPRAPNCAVCPLHRHCQARRRGVQEDLPVRAARRSPPQRNMVAAVIVRDGTALIRRRRPDQLLGGLWGFPEGELRPGENRAAGLRRILRQDFGLRVKIGSALPTLRHSYTHFQVTRYAYLCELRHEPPSGPGLRWVRGARLSRFPMGKLDRALGRLWTKAAVRGG